MTRHRTCPRDTSKLQGQLVLPGGGFFVCPTCHGMWVHKTDLEAFLSSSTPSMKLPPADVMPPPVPKLDNSTRCLCDAAPLMKTVSRRSVRIEICRECKGIWLDGGELSKLDDAGLTSIHESNVRHFFVEVIRELLELD